jgi:type VI secretion system secreted protein Hcp
MCAGALPAAQTGVVNGCVSTTGALRVVSDGACRANEVAISWNVAGPAGPAGPEGPAGPAGRDGRDGRDATGPAPPVITMTGTMSILDDDGPGPVVPIITFGIGATNTTTEFGGGGGTGKVNFATFNLTKLVDGYSLPLLQATATGRHLRAVEIKLYDSGAPTPFAIYRLEDVLVLSSQFGGGPTGVIESVSLDFSKIHSTIALEGGTFISCYDVKANKSC